MKWLYLALSAVFLIGFVVSIYLNAYEQAMLALVLSFAWVIVYMDSVGYKNPKDDSWL